MEFVHSLAQLDWIRGLRFWLLVGAGLAAWQAAELLSSALVTHFSKK